MNNSKIKSDYDYNKIKQAFRKVSLKHNDSIFLYTILEMPRVPNTNKTNYLLIASRMLLNSIQNVIEENDNIFVPTVLYFHKKKYGVQLIN